MGFSGNPHGYDIDYGSTGTIASSSGISMPSGSTAEYDLRSGGETSTQRTYAVSKLCALRGDQLLDFQTVPYSTQKLGTSWSSQSPGHSQNHQGCPFHILPCEGSNKRIIPRVERKWCRIPPVSSTRGASCYLYCLIVAATHRSLQARSQRMSYCTAAQPISMLFSSS